MTKAIRISLSFLTVLITIIQSSGLRANPAASPPQAPSTSATSLHQWLVGKMVSWMPPGHSFIPEAKETVDEGLSRYAEIADAMISAAYDPNEKPIFSGKYGRAMTLALMASVSWFESGYRRDVDLSLGPLGRGDSGKSWCMMQILLGKSGLAGRTRQRIVMTVDGGFSLTTDPGSGWGGEDLVTDRAKCFQAGLRILRGSFHVCRALPVEDRLGAYGSGHCILNWIPSRARVQKAQRWLAEGKPPLSDDDVMKLLHPPVQGPSGDVQPEGPASVGAAPDAAPHTVAFFPMSAVRRGVMGL